MHFGSRHAMDGFEFCDTTHCQDLRLAGINPHLRRIADATAGEVLWYDGEPAATYYFANCGGTTEDGHYILGNDEARAPYLTQHSDQYCVRDGGSPMAQRSFQARVAAGACRRRHQYPRKPALGFGSASHLQRTGGIRSRRRQLERQSSRDWLFALPSDGTLDGTA